MTQEKAIQEAKEIWMDIQGYESLYQVSSLGRVASKRSGIMKPSNILGYHSVGLSKNGTSKGYRVHRLVAMNFIPNPKNKPTVNHINGIKDDNRVENLEWATISENTKHAFDTGLRTFTKIQMDLWMKHISTKRKIVIQLSKEGAFIKEWESIEMAGKQLKISPSSIAACCRGRYKTTGGFIWKIKNK